MVQSANLSVAYGVYLVSCDSSSAILWKTEREREPHTHSPHTNPVLSEQVEVRQPKYNRLIRTIVQLGKVPCQGLVLRAAVLGSMVKPPCLLGLSAPGSRSSACRFELCEVRERCQGNVVGCSEGRMLLVSFSLLATNVEFRD